MCKQVWLYGPRKILNVHVTEFCVSTYRMYIGDRLDAHLPSFISGSDDQGRTEAALDPAWQSAAAPHSGQCIRQGERGTKCHKCFIRVSLLLLPMSTKDPTALAGRTDSNRAVKRRALRCSCAPRTLCYAVFFAHCDSRMGND